MRAITDILRGHEWESLNYYKFIQRCIRCGILLDLSLVGHVYLFDDNPIRLIFHTYNKEKENISTEHSCSRRLMRKALM